MNLIEAFKAFPDVNKVIIIKSDMIRTGVKFTQTCLDKISKRDDVLFKGFMLFSYDFDKAVSYDEKIPFNVFLADGTEEGTPVNVRTHIETPYVIDYIDGEYWVTWNGKKLCTIWFDKKPKYFSRTLEDGTPMAAIANCYGHLVFLTANKYCEYFSKGKQCLFCDLTTHAAEQKKAGEVMVLRKHFDDVCEVLEVAFKDSRFRTLFITGGTFFHEYQGKTELEWYAELLEAIGKRLIQWPITVFQIGALADEGWRRIHDTGVPMVQVNLEVWGKRLFEIICPGKNEAVGYDEWIRRMIRAVDFFGPGNVSSNFVQGVEMAKPFGFTDVDEAVDSTIQGHDFLMKNGILPRMGNIWCIEPGSKLYGQESPPLEYYIKLGRAFNEVREKYFSINCPWSTRDYQIISTEEDFAYWHGNYGYGRKAEEKDGIKVETPDYTKYLDY